MLPLSTSSSTKLFQDESLFTLFINFGEVTASRSVLPLPYSITLHLILLCMSDAILLNTNYTLSYDLTTFIGWTDNEEFCASVANSMIFVFYYEGQSGSYCNRQITSVC